MRADLVHLFENARVPRYTSYPTANHFGPLAPATFEAWLRELPPHARLSLYVHIPWCRQLCWYCGCHTWIDAAGRRAGPFVDQLLREIDRVSAVLPGRMPVVHLHFGGGTPSSVGAGGLRRIVGRLRDRFAFTHDAELAIELDPREVDGELVAALAELGFTRASLGVQTLDLAVQEAIGRIQPEATVERAFALLHGAGIRRISVDLMYGLPRQTVASVRASARRLADLAPARFAVFGYAHLPQLKKHQRLVERHPLPGAAERVAQFEAVAEELGRAGYVAIGLDHFARPDDDMAEAAREGRLRRNFQGYTVDPADALIGFGPSAISDLPQGYAQMAPDLNLWRQRVEAGEPATARGRAVSAVDRAMRAVIERIMCDLRVDLTAVAAAHRLPQALLEPDPVRFAELGELGVVEREGAVIRMPEEMRPLLRVVAACFDRYLAPGAGRHAAAL